MTVESAERPALALLWKGLLFMLILQAAQVPAVAEYPAHRVGISHRYPTDYGDWANAFLAGNGKMGIMVFGDPLRETVVYNDRGFNLAKTNDRTFAQVSAADLETIKDDCAKGDFAAANALAVSSAHYRNGGEGNRHPGYEMAIAIPEDGPITDYSRVCDFRTGEIAVRWTDRRGQWERRAFVSRADDVVVQILTAPTRGKLTCAIRLTTDPKMDFPAGMVFDSRAATDLLTMRVKYPANPADAGYEGVTRVVVSGGSERVDGGVLHISGADSALLLTRTARYDADCESHWNREEIRAQLAAVPADYARLLARQRATHGAIYDRVRIDLGASAADRARTNEDLLALQKTSPSAVKALWERLFDAGRYYFLSSSSEETPPDLLGIWTGDCNAGWGGFYHLDANLNLQVAGGNIGNMPEAMEGYFRINESWRRDFGINARKLLGCRGMLAGGAAPCPGDGLMAAINDYYPYHYATGEEPWLLYPFWEHYLITGDKAFLRDRLYPLLRDMGDFYEDFLTKKDAAGNYIFAGSVSPENQPSNVHVSLVNNSTFDLSGARFALTTLIKTCDILGVDQGPGQAVARWKEILDHLPHYRINGDGALAEWAWPGLDDNYNHRHSSHLLPVWPYREITPETEPALYKAASVTLEKKDQFEYEGAGHGLLHSALIAAGLNNDASVDRKLLRLSREGFYYDSLCSSHYGNHGTFCTDVCNTVPGILMEMLVSSRPGVLELLPALPRPLDHGAISGVKGRNRVTVQNLSWDLTRNTIDCTLRSDIDQEITLIQRDGITALTTQAKTGTSPYGSIARIVSLRAGVNTRIALTMGHRMADQHEAPLRTPLSQGKPVTASSVRTLDGDVVPGNVVDGDEGTRWSSDYADDQWIMVDLGAVHPIDEVKLEWEAAAGKDYDIAVSEDGHAWTVARSVTGNASVGWLDYTGLKARGRYVRIDCKTRLTGYGFSLKELKVFGK